jgi:lipopolysaccharide transport system permease protein
MAGESPATFAQDQIGAPPEAGAPPAATDRRPVATDEEHPPLVGGHRTPIGVLREFWRYRELLWNLVLRDIRVRYKQSLLGAAWAIAQPLAMMIVFTIVFTRILKVESEGVPYPIFSYSALLPWTFFATALNFAVPSLVSNMNLVTKIYFPREIFPIAAVIACGFDFLVASTIFAGLMAYYHVPITVNLLYVPLIVLVQVLFTFGIVLLASALNVFYRDMKFVIALGVQIWMYATPIIYPVALIPERFRSLYMLNPMAGIIDAYRKTILHGQPPELFGLGIGAAVALVTFLLSYVYFKRSEMQFADVI